MNATSIFERSKIYRIYFINGPYVDIKADDDEVSELVDDEILVLFNGTDPKKEEVAVFMLDNIAGFSIIEGTGTTKYWYSDDQDDDE